MAAASVSVPTMAEIHETIEEYAAGAGAPAREIFGLTREQMLARPVPGTWSIQEITLHLMDSDLIGADRMKRIAAEKNPLLIGYDENAFVRTLSYHTMDAELACDIFEKNRLMTAAMLRTLPPEAFVRTGVHSEKGKLTLAYMVKDYSNHLEHHLHFIREKRGLLRAPVPAR